MIDKTVAETKWCPFALAQSEVKECSVTGEKHPDCLCITNNCMAYMANTQDKGWCSAGDKHMQRF